MIGAGPNSQRLAQLGLELPPVAAPVAAYVPAILDGDLVWTAGQLPFVDGALPETGVVGSAAGQVDPDRAATYARVAVLNAIAAAAEVAGGVDNLERVVKLTGFVASDPTFTAQPQVINGASNLLLEVFGANGNHARSAVGVAVLPANAPVEIELVCRVRRGKGNTDEF